MNSTNRKIEFQQIQNIDHPDFEVAIALYKQTFPAYERVPVAWIQESILAKKAQLWVGYYQQELALMSILYTLPSNDFILLVYLATVPHLRNIKIGSQFLNYIIDFVKNQSKTLVLEVEHPDFGEDRELKQRRVGFYQRLGAKKLQNILYILPALDGTKTTEMLLMVIPYEHNLEKLNQTIVKQLIQELYQVVYRRPTNDPIFNWIDKIKDDILLTDN